MMRYLRITLVLVLGFRAAPLAAEAQQAGTVYRIGILGIAPGSPGEKAFRQGLCDLGWIEGQNIILERRYYQGRYERLPELAAELVSLNVDAIVAWSAPEAGAAKQATKTIPIVFLVHGDPLVTGHVASLAKPGGNATGLTLMQPELSAKRMELLSEAFPGLSRVAVLWNSANPIKASELADRVHRIDDVPDTGPRVQPRAHALRGHARSPRPARGGSQANHTIRPPRQGRADAVPGP